MRVTATSHSEATLLQPPRCHAPRLLPAPLNLAPPAPARQGCARRLHLISPTPGCTAPPAVLPVKPHTARFVLYTASRVLCAVHGLGRDHGPVANRSP